MVQTFNKVNKVTGTLSLSGDKSISHRALLISSLAEGKSYIKNLSENDDVKSTINCLKALGITVESNEKGFIVNGQGYKGYRQPLNPLNAGNSGTTARLLTGILSAQNFKSVITGDASLSSRPMKRIIEQLTLMGSSIKSTNEGRLPLNILPAEGLRTIKYNLLVPSAQVKSSILFAALHIDEQTSVIESIQTRNHTENLLDLEVIRREGKILSFVSRRNYPEPKEYFIPGDISSAMFFIVLALLTKNSGLLIKDVALNPTRTECLSLLKRMGGNIQVEVKDSSNNEAYGDLQVKSSNLSNVKIDKEIIPFLIDEIPILAVAGIFAEGDFEIRKTSELRVKESDRIKALCSNFSLLGLNVDEFEDGFRISGDVKKTTQPFKSFGDHRIAMAYAILSSLLESGGAVEGFECASVSNPDFLKQLNSITL